MTDEYQLKEGTDKWVRYIKWRVRKNKNFLGVFIGQTGSGKSYGALSLADILSDGKLPKENICFTGKEFIKRLRTGLADGTLKKGDVIVWDEAGVDLNSKQWMAATHRAINIVMQIFRKENIVVLFTVPFLSFIDSDTRKLIHTCFRTKRIDFTTKELVTSPINLQPNQMSGKIYTHNLKAKVPVGNTSRKVKVKNIRIPLARQDLIDYYEGVKNNFNESQYEKSEKVFDDFEGKDNEIDVEYYKKLIDDYYNIHKDRTNDEWANILNIERKRLYRSGLNRYLAKKKI